MSKFFKNKKIDILAICICFAIVFAFYIFYSGRVKTGSGTVEFTADVILDMSGLGETAYVASNSKCDHLTISATDLNVSGIWDGIAFLLKAPCHKILQLTPSGGTADLTFSSNNVSSGYISQWIQNSSVSVQVTTTVWANANANYTVKVDGTEITGSPFDSGDSGEVSFTREGQGISEEFKLIPPNICPSCQKYWAPLSCDYKIITECYTGGDTNDSDANVYPTPTVEFTANVILDLSDLNETIYIGSGAKCDSLTILGTDFDVSGIWDGTTFLLETSSHKVLELIPSGGKADLSFSSNYVSSGGYVSQWTETSSVSVATTETTVGTQDANTDYTVKVDGAEISGSPFNSGSSAEVNFTRASQGIEVFTISPK